MREILAAALLGLILATSNATAGQFEEGQAAFLKGDFKTAFALWKPLAEKGSKGAQLLVGRMYQEGSGVPKDSHEAARWLTLSANQGLDLAQWYLGFMYVEGDGVPKDLVTAHMWFSLAARQGDETAIKLRKRVAQDMTPEQIAEAVRRAQAWHPSTD